MLWISLPSIVIPKVDKEKNTIKIDHLYQQIFLVFSHSNKITKDNLLLPRCASEMEGEELAAMAIKPLLETYTIGELPSVLVDCRSSAPVGGPAPTYKLAAKTGLPSILPFSIGGQAGSEVVQALFFLQHMEQIKNKGAIISAVQRVVPPDTRVKEHGFPLADAAASIFLSNCEIKVGKSFKVLGIGIEQKIKNWQEALDSVLTESTERAGIKREEIKWAIAHRFSNAFLIIAQKALPDSTWLTRDWYPEFDFGCADSLISLNCFFGKKIASSPNGIGIVLFAGRFGAIGAILLKSYNGR